MHFSIAAVVISLETELHVAIVIARKLCMYIRYQLINSWLASFHTVELTACSHKFILNTYTPRRTELQAIAVRVH